MQAFKLLKQLFKVIKWVFELKRQLKSLHVNAPLHIKIAKKKKKKKKSNRAKQTHPADWGSQLVCWAVSMHFDVTVCELQEL
jgi:hypothetical protein